MVPSRTAVVLVLTVPMFVSCYRSSRSEGPTTPQQLDSVPIVIVPVPVPVITTPAPSAPSAPSGPAAPATPPPRNSPPLAPGQTPEPSDVTVYCSPWIPPDGYNCPRNPDPQLWVPLSDAIVKLMTEQPRIFDGNRVLDAVAYYNGTFKNLYDMGYCAVIDGNEVAISNRGDTRYRENYQILSSAGMVRRSALAEVSACAR